MTIIVVLNDVFGESYKNNESAYRRVSTTDQDIEKNKFDILKLANDQGLGPVPWVEETVSGLRDFLALLPTETRAACEFRDSSWFDTEVYDLLQEYRTGWVINDSSQFPSQEMVTSDPVYIRFHGPGALYASAYTIDDLNRWAAKIIQ